MIPYAHGCEWYEEFSIDGVTQEIWDYGDCNDGDPPNRTANWFRMFLAVEVDDWGTVMVALSILGTVSWNPGQWWQFGAMESWGGTSPIDTYRCGPGGFSLAFPWNDPGMEEIWGTKYFTGTPIF